MEKAWKELSGLIANVLKELNDLLLSCQRFWNDADALHGLLKDTDSIIKQEVGEPCVELTSIEQQMEVFEVFRWSLFYLSYCIYHRIA